MKINGVIVRLKKNQNMNDMNVLNSMNCTHNNEVNNMDEVNLPHDTLNPSKHTKNINIHC